MPPKNLFVLDTSALLAFRGDEPGADRVERLLLGARNGQYRLLGSFVTRMELLYVVWREEGEEAAREALRLADSFPIEWVSCEPEILDSAAGVKARGGLSLADSWIAATTLVRDATLIHKDPEFSDLRELSQEMLKR
jgi:predicted nucleic acid-binding protein